MSASHRFSNALRYRDDAHPNQRQLTPPYILEPVREALGRIDLDPCTEPDNPTGATKFYTPPVDGAVEPWDAPTIYVNPPYSKARERWVARCLDAARAGSRVVLLIPSHTDTRLFHRAIDAASHVVFIKGRVKFGILRANRRQEAASHPSSLICWNLPTAEPLAHLGAVWELNRSEETVMAKHVCCACFTHNDLPCCNTGHPDTTGVQAVRSAWARSPLLCSVRALRECLVYEDGTSCRDHLPEPVWCASCTALWRAASRPADADAEEVGSDG